jgi:hypothetical protein
MTDDRKERLEAALRAVVAAKNPFLAASIRAALRGEDDFDPFQGMSIHPEIDELWSSE